MISRIEGTGRKNIGAAGNILLENVILHRAAQLIDRHTLLLAHRNHHRQQDRRRRVDRHADTHFVQRQAIEQNLHIAQTADADANLAHFTLGKIVIGVITNLRRQIKGDGKPRLPLGQQIMIALVALRARAKPGILAHGPQAPAIHVGLDAARKGIVTRETELFQITFFAGN